MHAKKSPTTPAQVEEDKKSEEIMSEQDGVGSEFERGESMEESEEEKKESDNEVPTQVNNQPSADNHNLQTLSHPVN